MQNNNRIFVIIAATILISFSVFISGCKSGDDNSNVVDPAPGSETASDCIGCHTDTDMLMATATPDTTSSSGSGEG